MYAVRMEMYDNTSTGIARLAWSSISQAYEIIPSGRFYPPSMVLTATPTPSATRTAILPRTATATPQESPTPGPSLTPRATRTPPAPLQNAEYMYDGDGTLVKSVINGKVIYFIGRLYQKQVDGQTVTEEKTYFNGAQTVAMRTNDTLYWLVGDHLGSTSLTASADGTLFSELRYTAYGEVRYDNGNTPTKFQYTGQLIQMDEIGLYYYMARFYDPQLMHFSQADTLVPQPRNSLAWDRYAYVQWNPVRYTDPSGHYEFENEPNDAFFIPATPGVMPARRSTIPYAYNVSELTMLMNKGANSSETNNGNFSSPALGLLPSITATPQTTISAIPSQIKIGPTTTSIPAQTIIPRINLPSITVADWGEVDWIDFGIDITGICADILVLSFPEGPGEVAEIIGTGVEIWGTTRTINKLIQGDHSAVTQLTIDQITQTIQENPLVKAQIGRVVPVFGIIGKRKKGYKAIGYEV